jgi:glucose/arabinose dehydrogenase
MPHKFLTLLLIFNLINCDLKSQITLDSTVVDTSTLIGGLDIPWEITWGPDNFIWCTERYGRVSRIDPSTGQQTEILNLSGSITEIGEAGLLGLVLHPDFNNSPYVYLSYVYFGSNDIFVRLSRYDYNNNALTNETVIIDSIEGNSTHVGMRMIFLPDTTILITTGDAQNQSNSQDWAYLTGKTLRLNDDGTIPSDNPNPNSPIWTTGHRNAQGLYRSSKGIIYSSEHGPTTDDELNIIEKGRNYGWSEVHGMCDLPNETQFCNDSNVYEPIFDWTPTIATSDIIVYEHSLIPEFENAILLTVLKDKKLKRLALDNSGLVITDEKDYFNNIWGRLRDICVAPDGRIFLATNGSSWTNTDPFTHSIVEIKPQGFQPLRIQESFSEELKLKRLGPDLYRFNHNIVNFNVYNISGQLICNSCHDNNELNTVNWSPGVYFITVLENTLNTKKIFKIVVN